MKPTKGVAGRLEDELRNRGVANVKTMNLGVNGAQTTDLVSRLKQQRVRGPVRADEPLTDRSSTPHGGWRIASSTREQVIHLRQQRRTMQQLASIAKISLSSVARICRGAGLSRLKNLEPPGPTIRYERDEPRELLHIDTKRLGRFDRVGHRITRKRSFGSKKQGFEFAFVAIDDASRLSYVELLADERSEAACAFLDHAVSWFASQHVRVERVMTDNGSAFTSRQFREPCTSITTTELIQCSATIRRSVAWIGTAP